MQVGNQSGQNVNWNQSGSNPPPGEGDDKGGTLKNGEETPDFPPDGDPPWTVTFTTPSGVFTSCKFSNPAAVVTLQRGGRITVSTGCD